MQDAQLSSHNVEGIHLERLAEIAAQNGVEVAALLSELGLDRRKFADPSVRFSLATFYRFLSEVERRGKVEGLGFKMGLRQGPLASGMFGYGLISSPTLGDGLRFAERYAALTSAELDIRLLYQGDMAIVRATPRFSLGDQLKYVIEEWIANHHLSTKELIGGPIRYATAHFKYPKPAGARIYARFLPCAVFFDEPENEIRFPRTELDRAYANSNPAIHNLAVGYCETALRRSRHDDDLVGQVRVRLSMTPHHPPRLEVIAEGVGVGVRTLRRRLRSKGVTYQSLLNEIRMDLGAFYLRETGLSPAEIANEVGYAEVTTFYRRFKKWSGHSPIAYRQKYNALNEK